jgi:hypothetical protein
MKHFELPGPKLKRFGWARFRGHANPFFQTRILDEQDRTETFTQAEVELQDFVKTDLTGGV